jgi:hypothetical protein
MPLPLPPCVLTSPRRHHPRAWQLMPVTCRVQMVMNGAKEVHVIWGACRSSKEVVTVWQLCNVALDPLACMIALTMLKSLLQASLSSVRGRFEALERGDGGWRTRCWWEEDNIDSRKCESYKEDEDSNHVVDDFNILTMMMAWWTTRMMTTVKMSLLTAMMIQWWQLMMAIWWQQWDDDAGMMMAASNRQEAPQPTPRFWGNNQLMLSNGRRRQRGDWGGRDNRASHCGCISLKVWVRESNKGAQEDGRWQMAGQPNLP